MSFQQATYPRFQTTATTQDKITEEVKKKKPMRYPPRALSAVKRKTKEEEQVPIRSKGGGIT
jgi:hypothetical protein